MLQHQQFPADHQHFVQRGQHGVAVVSTMVSALFAMPPNSKKFASFIGGVACVGSLQGLWRPTTVLEHARGANREL